MSLIVKWLAAGGGGGLGCDGLWGSAPTEKVTLGRASLAVHVARERRSREWDSNHLLTQPTSSLLESSWNSRIKCFARIYWSVNTFDGQLSWLNVSIRSEFCSSSDLYLLIQQNWTVSQEPIDPVKISMVGDCGISFQWGQCFAVILYQGLK